MKIKSLPLMALALACAASACGPEGNSTQEVSQTESAATAPIPVSYGDYVAVERDLRKCIHPLCGGFWVSALNGQGLRCADGTVSKKCYVVELDLRHLGFTPEEERKFIAQAEVGQAYLQGFVARQVFPNFGYLGIFRSTEGFVAANRNRPVGKYYRAEDLGFVCVRAPCFNQEAELVNVGTITRYSDLDLRRVGATPGQLAAAQVALDNGKLLIAGALLKSGLSTSIRPGNTGVTLRATQFYLPVR